MPRLKARHSRPWSPLTLPDHCQKKTLKRSGWRPDILRRGGRGLVFRRHRPAKMFGHPKRFVSRTCRASLQVEEAGGSIPGLIRAAMRRRSAAAGIISRRLIPGGSSVRDGARRQIIDTADWIRQPLGQTALALGTGLFDVDK